MKSTSTNDDFPPFLGFESYNHKYCYLDLPVLSRAFWTFDTFPKAHSSHHMWSILPVQTYKPSQMSSYGPDEQQATNTVIGIVFGVLLLLVVSVIVSCCLRGRGRTRKVDLEKGILRGGHGPRPFGPRYGPNDYYIRTKHEPKAPGISNKPGGSPLDNSSGPQITPPYTIDPPGNTRFIPPECSESDICEEPQRLPPPDSRPRKEGTSRRGPFSSVSDNVSTSVAPSKSVQEDVPKSFPPFNPPPPRPTTNRRSSDDMSRKSSRKKRARGPHGPSCPSRGHSQTRPSRDIQEVSFNRMYQVKVLCSQHNWYIAKDNSSRQAKRRHCNSTPTRNVSPATNIGRDKE